MLTSQEGVPNVWSQYVNECRSKRRNGTARPWFLGFLPNLAGLRQIEIEIIICFYFVTDKPRLFWEDDGLIPASSQPFAAGKIIIKYSVKIEREPRSCQRSRRLSTFVVNMVSVRRDAMRYDRWKPTRPFPLFTHSPLALLCFALLVRSSLVASSATSGAPQHAFCSFISQLTIFFLVAHRVRVRLLACSRFSLHLAPPTTDD